MLCNSIKNRAAVAVVRHSKTKCIRRHVHVNWQADSLHPRACCMNRNQQSSISLRHLRCQQGMVDIVEIHCDLCVAWDCQVAAAFTIALGCARFPLPGRAAIAGSPIGVDAPSRYPENDSAWAASASSCQVLPELLQGVGPYHFIGRQTFGALKGKGFKPLSSSVNKSVFWSELATPLTRAGQPSTMRPLRDPRRRPSSWEVQPW